jgi:excisionase family DNA binding protein
MLPNAATSTGKRLTREDVMDVREVAALLRLAPSTVFDYARRGLLPAHRLGRRWIFLREELDAAVRSVPRTDTAPAPTDRTDKADQSAAERPEPDQQPPASQPTKARRETLKRYPRVVPDDHSSVQGRLFT